MVGLAAGLAIGSVVGHVAIVAAAGAVAGAAAGSIACPVWDLRRIRRRIDFKEFVRAAAVGTRRSTPLE